METDCESRKAASVVYCRSLGIEQLEPRLLLSGLTLVAQYASAQATVSVYDVDGDDVEADDVSVRFGDDGSVKRIELIGDPAHDGLGIVVSGSTYVGAIKDARGGDAAPVAFLAADSAIGSVKINSGLAGFDLNGRTLGGLTFADDMDGDGDSADPTALYAAGAVGKIKVRGAVSGDVLVGGTSGRASLGKFGVKDGGMAGDLVAEGGMGKVKLEGAFTGAMDVGGSLGSLNIKGGDLDGLIRVGGDVGKLKVKAKGGRGGNVGENARIAAAGTLGKLKVGGSVQGAGTLPDQMAQVLAGAVGKASVKGDVVNAMILAGADLGEDWSLGGEGDDADTFGEGAFGKMSVGGDVVDSMIGAGWQPNGGELDLQWLVMTGGFVPGSSMGKVKVRGGVASSAEEGIPFGIGACSIRKSKIGGDGEEFVLSDESWPPEIVTSFDIYIEELADCPVAQALGISPHLSIDLPDLTDLFDIEQLQPGESLVLELGDLPNPLILEMPDFPEEFDILVPELEDCPFLDMLDIGENTVVSIPDLSEWEVSDASGYADAFVLVLPAIPDTVTIQLGDSPLWDLLDLETSVEVDFGDVGDTWVVELDELADCPVAQALNLPHTLVIEAPYVPETLTLEVVL